MRPILVSSHCLFLTVASDRPRRLATIHRERNHAYREREYSGDGTNVSIECVRIEYGQNVAVNRCTLFHVDAVSMKEVPQ